MARINQTLLAKIQKRLGVTKSRVYAVVNETASKYSLPADIAALVVARDAGIAITRFATPEDWILIRGVHSVQAVTPAPAPAPAASSPLVARPARRGRTQARPRKTTDKVWVVYGRDEKRRDAVFTFLRSVGLRPIEWTSALAATKKGSPQVFEAVDTGFEDSGATVVLLTPDDEARLKREFLKEGDPAHEKNLTGQPRQNVLFEAGIAFGRHPNKTISRRGGYAPANQRPRRSAHREALERDDDPATVRRQTQGCGLSC